MCGRVEAIGKRTSSRTPRDVLTLKSDLTMGWVKGHKWDRLVNQLRLIVAGEMEEVGSFLSCDFFICVVACTAWGYDNT
jgi:hypothetical protein